MSEEGFNGIVDLFEYIRIKFRVNFVTALGPTFNGDLRNSPDLKDSDVIVADFPALCQQKAAADIAYFFG